MSAHVIVLVGPARCGKTYQLLQQYGDVLRRQAAGGLGRALWLSPTSRTSAAIREQLLANDLDACLDPGVTTFDRLADQVLAALPRPPRSLTKVMRRQLVGRVVESSASQNRLESLAAAARHPSFIDLLAEHFDELKRRDIGPDVFAKLSGSDRHRNRHQELARLYRDYEQLLSSHNLVDSEGRHSAARDALADNDLSVLPQLELIVADGFTDFTYMQHEILRQLTRRAGQLLVSLPGDESGRGDLFAKSTATLAELRRFHPRLEVRPLPFRPTNWPALDHLATNVFRHPRDFSPLSPDAQASLDRVHINAAAGPQDEIGQLARAIKQRLIADTPRTRPDDIVVVFRHLQDVAPRIRAVFDEFGIPYSLEARLPLLGTGVIRTLLALLRLDAENWPFRRTLSVVTNTMLATFDRPARASTEWFVRDLQIAKGRQELLGRIGGLLPTVPPDESRGENSVVDRATSTHQERRAAAAVAANSVLNELAAALDDLPQAATPTEWITALTRLGQRFGIATLAPLLVDADALSPDPQLAENRIAWQCVSEHFASLERLAAWMGTSPPKVSRGGLIKLLVDVAQHESQPRGHDDAGRVRVLSAVTARTVDARHVFLANMTEQAFPSAESTNRLYTETDYRAFSRAAHSAPESKPAPPVSRPQEEMLLFYEVLTRASDRLTISYPALDDKAQDLPPSPYVTELERTVERDGEPASLERTLAPRPLPLPSGAAPLSPSDWRIEAVHRALASEDDAHLLAGLFHEPATTRVADSIAAALEVNAARRREKFSPAEGLLESSAVRKRLAQRFGPEHLWSPSQFEAYARCPYDFFLEDVLGLEPLGELTLDTDFRRRGSLWHRVLARFHRELQEKSGGSPVPSQQNPEQFAAELLRVLNDEAANSQGTGVDAALVDLDRRHIIQWVETYFEQHGKYDKAWTAVNVAPAPAYFEFRFGPPRREENEREDPNSIAQPFLLDLGDEQIRVTGRIDRIDVGEHAGRTVFTVIDYKSGARPTLTAEKIATGERLQPALYVMAAQALLFGGDKSTPLWAGYWSMAKGATTEPRYSLRCSDDNTNSSKMWDESRAAAIARIREIVAGIRQGDFPVASRDDHCTSVCPYSTVCRVTQIRSLEKQWHPD